MDAANPGLVVVVPPTGRCRPLVAGVGLVLLDPMTGLVVPPTGSRTVPVIPPVVGPVLPVAGVVVPPVTGLMVPVIPPETGPALEVAGAVTDEPGTGAEVVAGFGIVDEASGDFASTAGGRVVLGASAGASGW